MRKLEIFRNELEHIENEDIKHFAEKAISKLPDYFFDVAASSTSKYHPKYALGDGGLVRHTRAAVAIAKDLLNLEMYGKYTQDEKDLMITALILHDGMKHGEKKSNYSVAHHPTIIAEWIVNDSDLNNILPQEQLNILTGCIASHMGEFNTDYKTKKEILPKPKTAMQKMVHMCDYLASRKYLEFDFGDTYYKPEDFKDTTAEELKATIDKIVAVCKEKIDNGVERDNVYSIISENNDGKKNPNSIADLSVARIVLEKLESVT